VDLTADVDFASLRRAVAPIAQEGHGLACYGPVGQGYFLHHMGATARLEQLLEAPSLSDEQAEALVDAYSRLVSADQMGERYKVLALVDSLQTSNGPPPGGFVDDTDSATKSNAEGKGSTTESFVK
jgi:NADH dehydrogenase [ubiquinone] 1 alpha subcomplex assembly factor 7